MVLYVIQEENYGIPTPVNDRIVEVVAGIQDGKYQYSPENIKYFKDLL